MAWGLDHLFKEPGELRWLTKRVHKPILDWLQTAITRWKTNRRRGIAKREQLGLIVPRGFGKTWLATKAAGLYMHVDEPNMSTYIGSETHPKAMEFFGPVGAVMSGEDPYAWFAWLYGNWRHPDRTWGKSAVVHGYRQSMSLTEPSYSTFSVEKGITGYHPLSVFYDDPISKEKLREGGTWLTAVLDSMDAIYPALRNDSFFCYVVTRYLDDDVAGSTMKTEGVKTWTGHPPDDRRIAEKIGQGVWNIYFLQARDLADRTEFPKGRPVLPEAGWDDEALSAYEARNSQEYNAQMMNSPGTGEHMPITRDQIDALVIKRKDLPPIEYATIHIDTAFKNDERTGKGDNSAIVVWLHDLRPTGIVYLDRVLYSNAWRSDQFDDQLLSTILDLRRRGIRIRAITDEAEMGGKRGVYRQHLEQLLTGADLRVPEILQFNRAGTRKTLRIREAAGYWIENFVRLIDNAPNREQLEDEMLKIGFAAHDDVSDAAADVFRPELWRRPVFDGTPLDDHPPLVFPGDEVLRDGRLTPRTNDHLRELYDAKYGSPEERDDY